MDFPLSRRPPLMEPFFFLQTLLFSQHCIGAERSTSGRAYGSQGVCIIGKIMYFSLSLCKTGWGSLAPDRLKRLDCTLAEMRATEGRTHQSVSTMKNNVFSQF